MSSEAAHPDARLFETVPRLRHPLLMVLSAASGAGKTTLCTRWVGEADGLVASVSCTTRPPRTGEVAGRSYHFLDEADFLRRVKRGDFLEHALVHGHHYGTLRETVLGALMAGRDIVMTIDVQGAAQLRGQALAPDTHPLIRNGFTDVFIVPPSFAVLRERLTGRGTDSEAVIATRLHNAAGEMERWREYRYVVVNDDLETALGRLRAIRQAEHCRLSNALAPDFEKG
ncbi:MAG: guanylate kinase [Kiritimatiellia bacterium]